MVRPVTHPISEMMIVRGLPHHWSEIRSADVVRWNRSRVEEYAALRGLKVEVLGRHVFIGAGVGRSFRSALVDLLQHEERRRADLIADARRSI